MTMPPSSVEAKVDSLVEQAMARAGLTDLGAPGWREGLTRMVDILENTRDVLPDGRDRLYGEFVDALWNRLRVTDYVKHHTDILDQKIERPLVILGLPRTGTTMASCFLAEDRKRRTLLNWEAADSVPPPTSASLRSDPRCIAKQNSLDQLLAFLTAQNVPLVHWEDADSPTECVFVQNQDFKTFLWETCLPNADFADWLMGDADLSSSYAYEKQMLQILQSKAPGTWSLKMPSHAVFVDALIAAFPDVRIVWAHRDPYKATASFLRMNQMARGSILGPALDMTKVVPNVLKQLRAHVENVEAARNRIGRDRIFDLHYADMIRDPIGQMRTLYAWAGDDFDTETEAAMRRWLTTHPQDRHGSSPYSLDAYGVTKQDLEPIFEDYVARYDIEPEGF